MSIFKNAKRYIDFLNHEQEPIETPRPITHIPVKSYGIPKTIIVRHTNVGQ